MRRQLETVTINKIAYGGQGIGTLPEGKTIFVWNALPREVVRVRVIRDKPTYAEGIAEEVLHPSNERVEPRDRSYLSTSPWQIMSFEAENQYKKMLIDELFTHNGLFSSLDFSVTHDSRAWHYRNKMEYSFWGDDAGLHLALFKRGSHSKQVIDGSALAMPQVDEAAKSILAALRVAKIRAGDLKTIVVRCAKNGTAAALFVKIKQFPEIGLPFGIKGLRIYYSDSKSPASIPTQLLVEHGDSILKDTLLGKTFNYDTESFFQVNVPMFERALSRMKSSAQGSLIDMYAGVGSIGLSIGTKSIDLIERDHASSRMANINARMSKLDVHVSSISAESALSSINNKRSIVFDPPRAGLHDKVVARLLEARPPQIIYLSCNPVTQARDLTKIRSAYYLSHFDVFNFFPRTPHIEVLAVLCRK